MILKGNPAVRRQRKGKGEIVFKDGGGYASEKLIQSKQGWLESGKCVWLCAAERQLCESIEVDAQSVTRT
jgi:hypothetical protein